MKVKRVRRANAYYRYTVFKKWLTVVRARRCNGLLSLSLESEFTRKLRTGLVATGGLMRNIALEELEATPEDSQNLRKQVLDLSYA